MTIEGKLGKALFALKEIAQEPCETPLFTVSDSGKPIISRCREQTPEKEELNRLNACPSCVAREALIIINV